VQVATPPGPCRFLETRLRAGSCSRPRHVQCTWGARRRTTAGSYRLPLQGRIDRWYWGDTTVQVATPPTASEFRGGIIDVTLRPVSGADFVSPITDEHLLHGVNWWFNFRLRSLLHSSDTWALHLALLQRATWRIQSMFMAVVHWIRRQTTVHHQRNLWAILTRI